MKYLPLNPSNRKVLPSYVLVLKISTSFVPSCDRKQPPPPPPPPPVSGPEGSTVEFVIHVLETHENSLYTAAPFCRQITVISCPL